MDSFKGTSAEQDIRFGDKERKLMKSMKFPPQLNTKVDMRKVELSVMKPWIAKKVMELLGFEDEVVIEYVCGLLEDSANPIVDGKKMMISLLGFLDKHTEPFMVELWTLLLSAQESPVKIPAIFIEQKKEEMRKRQEEKGRNDEMALVRQNAEQDRERRIEEIRQRERGSRDQNRSSGRGGYQGGRDGRSGPSGSSRGDRDRGDRRDHDRRRHDDDRRRDDYRSRSDNRDRYRRDDRDRGRSRSRTPPRRRRSPSYDNDKGDTTPKYDSSRRSRSRSRSRSPPRRRSRRSVSRSRSPAT
ncbi:PWI domain-containing protein [Cystobasidium minutum MCA 4210]|uniref:PWI domain-containing protein n=1 Tax=Cystobasidium minutum MCA 4210 TaxID=1397322 RepID=UPI0034CFFB0F|eukprot:jgi/Rhomi1/167204/fgenesh1_kg.2_\